LTVQFIYCMIVLFYFISAFLHVCLLVTLIALILYSSLCSAFCIKKRLKTSLLYYKYVSLAVKHSALKTFLLQCMNVCLSVSLLYSLRITFIEMLSVFSIYKFKSTVQQQQQHTKSLVVGSNRNCSVTLCLSVFICASNVVEM